MQIHHKKKKKKSLKDRWEAVEISTEEETGKEENHLENSPEEQELQQESAFALKLYL